MSRCFHSRVMERNTEREAARRGVYAHIALTLGGPAPPALSHAAVAQATGTTTGVVRSALQTLARLGIVAETAAHRYVLLDPEALSDLSSGRLDPAHSPFMLGPLMDQLEGQAGRGPGPPTDRNMIVSWGLPGHGQPKDTCGGYMRVAACPVHVREHLEVRRRSCNRLDCPVCRDGYARRAGRRSELLLQQTMEAAQEYYAPSGWMHLRMIHGTLSPPQALGQAMMHTTDDYRTLSRMAHKRLGVTPATDNECGVCGAHYRLRADLDAHVDSRHIHCVYCHTPHRTLRGLRGHVCSAHHACRSCVLYYRTADELDEHVAGHEAAGDMICRACTRTFRTARGLAQHPCRGRRGPSRPRPVTVMAHQWGGLTVYHPFRRLRDAAGRPGPWVDSPHWHYLGFGFCRSGKEVYDDSGWVWKRIADGALDEQGEWVPEDATDVPPDGDGPPGTGGRSVARTVEYLLSHAGVMTELGASKVVRTKYVRHVGLCHASRIVRHEDKLEEVPATCSLRTCSAPLHWVEGATVEEAQTIAVCPGGGTGVVSVRYHLQDPGSLLYGEAVTYTPREVTHHIRGHVDCVSGIAVEGGAGLTRVGRDDVAGLEDVDADPQTPEAWASGTVPDAFAAVESVDLWWSDG